MGWKIWVTPFESILRDFFLLRSSIFFALSFGKFNVVSRSITRDNELLEIIGEERFRGISKLISINLFLLPVDRRGIFTF